MLDLSYDMSPLFDMLLKLVIWMFVPGLIAAYIFRKLVGVLFKLIVMGVVLGGAYAYFKFGMT